MTGWRGDLCCARAIAWQSLRLQSLAFCLGRPGADEDLLRSHRIEPLRNKGSGKRARSRDEELLLGTVGLVVLSMAAPASAADLAARPYAKAPLAMVAADYDWSGFYVSINGG
jgi:hypothetical protein